ncbi:unnamed protein product [Allacma fusca]|uniref:CRAL-TRIO domain-containing protein n=1 Tax=Allacma fusca TaxID=39272 RepID=A0A8J2Q721_9HEXA|nr:unnamed protein product [Allacma fusca]
MSQNFEEYNMVLQELRKRISDIIQDNVQFEDCFYIYFWLNARRFDIDATEALIRETARWRKSKDAIGATKADYHPGIQKCFPIRLDGKSKTGFAVFTGPAGKFRFGETIKKFGREAIEYYWLQLLCKAEKLLIEYNREVRKQNGSFVSTWPPIQKSWLILDITNLSVTDLLSRDVLGVVLTLIKMAVTHFPVLEGNLVFINAGTFTELFFKIIRPMLTDTKIDMLVFGTNKNKWKPFILQHIDPRQIETLYGGTLDELMDSY